MKAAILFTLLILAISISGQPASPGIDVIIRRATEQRLRYVDTFKNLLTQETKTIEVFDRDARVRKRRVIKSNFIVYSLAKDDSKTTEYRNVSSVDGRSLNDAESRAQEFFEKIASVESSSKELDRIRDESLRFDEDILISNMTLFQSIALADTLRPSFDFTISGTEAIDGRTVYVIDYRQTRPSQHVAISHRASDGMSSLIYDVDLDGLKDVECRLAGRFWIDAETFNLVREHRVFTIQPVGYESPIPLSENRFEYRKSDFEVFTPHRITHLQFEIDKKRRTSRKDIQVTFEYGAFSRPDVDVKASDVKAP